MSIPGPNETSGLAWGKLLLGIGVLILGASFAFSGSEWWQFVTAAVAGVFGLILLITGTRELALRRRAQLTARDEERENGSL
jgi:hypothetical protein